MKNHLLKLCLILSFTGFAQSTINFVSFRPFGWSFSIYLNDILVGSIGPNENMEYKVYSEGRISVIIIGQSARYTGIIDVKKGNTYYYLVSAYPAKQGITDNERGARLFSENENTVKAEEDKRRPIGSMQNASGEASGPKQGTCFLVNNKGYMITNYHVISGANTIQVKGIGGDFTTLYGADVVAFDTDLDLALIKVKNKNIVFDSVPYRLNFDANKQGEKTFLLGYPLTASMGNEIKVTEGLISANSGYKGTISQYQFSAPIQPGNSGSPLFDEKGNVLGVINSKLSDAEGVGYAIKSQYVSTFLKLIDNVTMDDYRDLNLGRQSLSEKISKLKNFVYIVKVE